MNTIKFFLKYSMIVLFTYLIVGCSTSYYARKHAASTHKFLGSSELCYAIKNADLDTIKDLVSSGADIHQVLSMKKKANNRLNKDFYQPALTIAIEQFHKGVSEERKAVVSYLLEQGADANGKNYDYEDDRLKIFDKSGVLALLLKPYREEGKLNRSDIKMYRDLGFSELALAIARDDIVHIKQLVSSGADIHKVPVIRNSQNSPDRDQSAIYLAANQFRYGITEKRKSIVNYFLEQGARTNNLSFTDERLHELDRTGVLSDLIIPYREKTMMVANRENTQTVQHRAPATVKQKKQQIEFEKMRMKIARLNEQVKNREAVNNNVLHQMQYLENSKNQKKIALVIGNSQYAHGALINPENDATDIASALQSLNFEVILKVNVDRKQMEVAIDEFSNNLTSGGIGLFYYAGHGVQIKGENYLIPIDARINKQSDVRYKAVNLGQVLNGMGEARNGLNVAILDACRDNPLPRSYRSSGNRGLARVSSPDGTLLAFATAPGDIASDGEGRNGLYTRYLLKHMKTKGITIEKMLKLVSRDVKQASKNKQTPWMESSFTGDFFF